MTTNQPGSTARQDPRNVSNTLRYRFNFNDPGLANGVQIGVLPQNAFITMQLLEIIQAFNAGTTNPLTAGTVAAAYNNLFTSADSGSAGATIAIQMTQIAVAANKYGRGLFQAGDTPVFLKYAPTGTAPTTGIGEYLIEFEGGFPG